MNSQPNRSIGMPKEQMVIKLENELVNEVVHELVNKLVNELVNEVVNELIYELVNELVGFHFLPFLRAEDCKRAVRNPLGKVNPASQNTCGVLLNIYDKAQYKA